MIFAETDIPGVVIVDIEKIGDERGFFARSFCAEAFRKQGLVSSFVQANVSFNREAATLRGMHYQAEPAPEAKLVRCTRGAIFDVAVDLRPGSPAFCRWIGIELAPGDHRAVYVPPGCAHGFVTLEADSEILYLMGAAYDPDLARGVRWNDPAFGIEWPIEPAVISVRDASFPDFES